MAPTKNDTGAAVAEPEPPAAAPQTAQEIAQTEQVLGIGPKTESRAVATRAPVRMGVAPTNIEEGWRMAQYISSSELVPKGYRGRPADVLVAIQYGMEVGLPPMAALHSIYVTNGRPSLWGDGFLAVIMASAAYKDHDEYYIVDGERRDFLVAADLAKDDTMAVTTFWRSDNPRPRTATFSIAKAKKAGLWTKQGPWTDYPDRMLQMRARSFSGHNAFPDVLRGMTSTEEAIDMPVVEEAMPVPAAVQPRRASEARAEAPAPSQPASQPAPAPTPKSAPPTNGDRSQEIRGLLITATSFVKPQTGEPYYEIAAKPAGGGVERKFLTRDEQLYKEAASFEGFDHRVVVRFHEQAKSGAAQRVQVIESLAIDEGATSAPAVTESELFG